MGTFMVCHNHIDSDSSLPKILSDKTTQNVSDKTTQNVLFFSLDTFIMHILNIEPIKFGFIDHCLNSTKILN